MADPEQPSERNLGKVAVMIIAIVVACAVAVFIAINVWHRQELKHDQATGENRATEHTPPNYAD